MKLSVVDASDVVGEVTRAIRTATPLSVTFLNPTYLMAARRDPGLAELISSFDLVLADGWGVVHGARFLGIPVPTRLANDDIGPDLFRESQQNAWRTYLFGCEPGVAELAGATLARLLPGLPVVGTRHGWWDVVRGHPGRFDEKDELAAVDAINAARPDVLWVSLPTPMQQQWVTTYRDRLDVPVVITGGCIPGPPHRTSRLLPLLGFAASPVLALQAQPRAASALAQVHPGDGALRRSPRRSETRWEARGLVGG